MTSPVRSAEPYFQAQPVMLPESSTVSAALVSRSCSFIGGGFLGGGGAAEVAKLQDRDSEREQLDDRRPVGVGDDQVDGLFRGLAAADEADPDGLNQVVENELAGEDA